MVLGLQLVYRNYRKKGASRRSVLNSVIVDTFLAHTVFSLTDITAIINSFSLKKDS